ncbi:MAG: diadenosine tetraphosphate hydrolase [Candidatus Moranbacteria bacterium]|jgi:diadenosine tetraphosphate (Ap4A) HIT family hydrolase|nr:diadenosine tetraphosphate hydrolase [Candidatus Moranbacteria bacterium]MBP9801934.1 diadenosine tetraphosphate hydrolase [Candidatus Moranbacteria bacterium]
MSNKTEIVDYKGNPTQISCLGCARENGEIERVGTVFTTEHFDAHQDFEIPLPGFIIISSRRHLQSVDEFTEEEKRNFIDTLVAIRTGMRKSLAIDTVYLIQEEDTKHHFHIWIFPRSDWMAEKFGEKTPSLKPIMEYARENLKTTENLKKVEEAVTMLKAYFESR